MDFTHVLEIGALAFLVIRAAMTIDFRALVPRRVVEPPPVVEPTPEPYIVDPSVPRQMPNLVVVKEPVPTSVAETAASVVLEVQDIDGQVLHEICTHTQNAPALLAYGGAIYRRQKGSDAHHFIYKETSHA